MKLLTKAIQKLLQREYEKPEDQKTNMAYAKFFNPTGAGTWYLMEQDPYTGRIFGYAHITEWEYGWFDFEEMAQYKGHFGLGIERDLWFEPTPIEDIKKAINEEQQYKGGRLN